MGYKVAVVGATGNVGREMLSILEERQFPVDEVHAIASRKSMGVEVSFGDRTLKCQDLEQFDFSKMDFCLMSAGSAVSKEWSPKIGATGCIVIDNSSCWRYDQEVPLIVPEWNAHALTEYMARPNRRNIIANPNCSTAQLVAVLKPLHDVAKIKRVVVSTYQSVSGAGKEGLDELWSQTKGIFVTDSPTPKKFTKQIAFNVIPHIDVFRDGLWQYARYPESAAKRFPLESFAPAEELMAAAKQAASQDRDASARVAFLSTGLQHAKLCVEASIAFAQAGDDEVKQRAAVEKLRAFRETISDPMAVNVSDGNDSCRAREENLGWPE